MAETSTREEQNIKGVNAIMTRSGKTLDGSTLPNNKSTTLGDASPLEPEKKFLVQQVPAYAKVIKDLCTMKKKHNVKKTAFLTEQVSAVIEQKTPPKYKDPGCPTITCHIETNEFSQALLDLGASVNLMPYLVYLHLGLGEIKPTSVVLQLADRSVRRPRGIVEDVLLQVDKFYYPVDFLLSFGNMTLEVNVFNVGKQPRDEDECYQTYLIDTLVQEEVHLHKDFESLDYLLHNSNFDPLLFLVNTINISADFDEKQDKQLKYCNCALKSCQEFDLTIKDKKGVENVVADYLSRLEFNDSAEGPPIRDDFPDEHLFAISQMPWYSHIVNYLVSGEIPSNWSAQDKHKFLVERLVVVISL
ncbi:uncharacterized protein LOC131160804 [Malania oleifera]|uniref:uncharacterized protein LOC131160804 n=1 Tax=Malania oleifera TaxID=397392 RepID=UPI0025ADD519|nr:uncharacterized protein LOC131160804 [Malania oleifera]